MVIGKKFFNFTKTYKIFSILIAYHEGISTFQFDIGYTANSPISVILVFMSVLLSVIVWLNLMALLVVSIEHL